ncbi:MAG: hypothetical protein WCW16_03865 [Candidatus Magasanikbacteria bacterium]
MNDVLKFGKKLFTFSVVTLTIVWSMGLAALVPSVAQAVTCPALEAGDLFQVKGNTAVYLVTSAMKRQYFFNDSVYKTWFPDFTGVSKDMDPTCTDAFPSGGSVPFRAGSYLVKTVVSPSVYAILPGGEVKKFSDPAVLASLYGANWGTMLRDYPDGLFDAAFNDNGASITSAVPHNGMLIKVAGGDTYYVDDGQKQKVDGTLSGVTSGSVRTETQSVFDSVPTKSGTITEAEILDEVVNTVSEVAGSLTASLAGDTPVGLQAAKGSIFNDVLHVRLAAGSQEVKVTGLTLKKTGLVGSTGFNGLSIWVGGDRHGAVVSSLDDNAMASIGFGSDPITVPANGSVTVSVQVNLTSTADASSFQMAVTKVDTTPSATVAGLPVTSNQATVVAGTLASYTVTTTAVSGYANDTTAANTANEGQLEIGDLQKEVMKFTLAESGNEDLLVESVTFFVQGTVSDDDIQNYTVYGPTGEKLGSTVLAGSDRYVTVPMNYTLKKGFSKTFTVKADALDGSNKYFALFIQSDYDVKAKGANSGYYVAPGTFASGGYTSSNGWFKMKQGSLSIQKSVSSPSNNISAGGSDTVLGIFDIKAIGEDVEIRKMVLEVEVGDPLDPDLTGNVKVVDAETGATYLSTAYTGIVFASSSYGDSAFASTTQRDLSTYLTIQSGKTKTVKVVANVGDGATGADSYMVKIGDMYLKRLSTLDFQNKPNTTTAYPGNVLTVNAASLTLAKNTSVGDMTVSSGGQNATLGSFKLQTGSSEGINISSVVLSFGTTTAVENVGLYLDGVLQGSESVTPSASTTYSVSILLDPNKVVSLDIKGDVKSVVPAGSFVMTVHSLTATGRTTGADATGSINATALQTITLGSPKLKVTNDDTVESKILIPGENQLIAVHKYEAFNSDIELRKVTYALRNVENVTRASSSNFGALTLKTSDGTVLATGAVVDDGTNATVVFTGFNHTIPSGATHKLYLYATVNGSGVMSPATLARAVVYSDANTDLEAYAATGLLARSQVGSSTYPTANETNFGTSTPMLFHNTAPVIALASDSPSGSATPDTETTLMKFTVTNPGARDMRINTTSVYISAAGLAGLGYVYDFKLYDGSTLLATYASSTFIAASGLPLFSEHVISSSTAALTAKFNTDYDTSSRMDNLTVSAGETKTFKVTANTSNIRTGLTAGQTANLAAKLDGATGFSQGDSTNEPGWANGVINYYYTPVNGSENTTIYTASDSYDVNGKTLTF